MKKVFKKLLLSSISLATVPIASCNKTVHEDKTIEIISSLDDIIVMQEETIVSAPIQAKCFGPDKKERELDIKFTLLSEESNTLPNWIYLTDNNEIRLTGGKNVGVYSFAIQAYNETEQIYSTTKTFKVNVVEERHIVPDSIDLEIEDNKYCMYGEETSIPVKVIPSKEGVEEKYLLKSCNFKVEVVSGIAVDLNNKPLFYFDGSNIDPHLLVSAATNSGYSMQYQLLITATLIADPTISVSKETTLNIDNIYYYYDSVNKYTYTRSSSDEDWTLSLLDSSIKGLSETKQFIQNKPVSIIGQNLCSKSQITKLIYIELPESITTIEDGAFENQVYLCLASMPGVKYVGNNAFYNNTILELDTSITEPSILRAGDYAFYNCAKLKFKEKQNLYTIGNFAFKNAGLSSITIGPNCNFLGQECFADCTSLSNFKIEALNPPKIGGANFANCSKLTTLYVPYESVELYKTNADWMALGKTIEGNV